MKQKQWLPFVKCLAYSIDKELHEAIDILRSAQWESSKFSYMTLKISAKLVF